jgi:CDP-4-dehydro-6-deoxyglucose reductase
MAKIIFQPDNIEREVEDGTRLIECCDEVGVSLPFGCTEGSCGVCELTVLKGMENLSKVAEEEIQYLLAEDLQKGMRLGCQLTVKKGEVVLSWKKNRSKP